MSCLRSGGLVGAGVKLVDALELRLGALDAPLDVARAPLVALDTCGTARARGRVVLVRPTPRPAVHAPHALAGLVGAEGDVGPLLLETDPLAEGGAEGDFGSSVADCLNLLVELVEA